jgi:hypothetical protein
MVFNKSNSYDQDIFHPEHPHRRIYILFFIIVFVLAIGVGIFYKLNREREVIVEDPRLEQLRIQREQAIIEIKKNLETSPPPTQEQINKAVEEIKKSLAQQKK